MNSQESLHWAGCFVTGGGGPIGSHLVHALLAPQAKVRLVGKFLSESRKNPSPLDCKIGLIEGDILGVGCVHRAMGRTSVVFGLPAVATAVRDPLSRPVAKASDAAACLRGLALWATEHDSELTLQVTESISDSPVPPCSAKEATGAVDAGLFWWVQGLRISCLRAIEFYGPGPDPQSVDAGVSRFLARLLAGGPPTITGDGGPLRDSMFVSDVARASIRAAESGTAAGRTFNVASGGSTTIRDLAASLARIVQPSTHGVPICEPKRGRNTRHSGSATRKEQRQREYIPLGPVTARSTQVAGWCRRWTRALCLRRKPRRHALRATELSFRPSRQGPPPARGVPSGRPVRAPGPRGGQEPPWTRDPHGSGRARSEAADLRVWMGESVRIHHGRNHALHREVSRTLSHTWGESTALAGRLSKDLPEERR